MGKPMKGRMPGAEALRRAFSPVTPEFAESTHSLLQALPKKRKEEPMKKKLSLALVLALILAALSGAVALALSAWREAGESLVQMEKEYGFYDEWSLENKLRLLSFMQDNQVSLDSELLQTALDPQADASAREAAVDQLIAARYGIDGRVDVVTAVSVLQTESEEEYRFWSLEDKASFGEIERKYNGLSQDGAIPLTPGEQDLTQEQAVEKARQALEAYRQYDAAAWQALEDAGARLAITYEYAPYDYDTYRHQPTWTLDWYIPDATGAYNDGPAETVMLDQTGETLYVANCGQTHPEAAEYNARYALYLEMEARLGPEIYLEPGGQARLRFPLSAARGKRTDRGGGRGLGPENAAGTAAHRPGGAGKTAGLSRSFLQPRHPRRQGNAYLPGVFRSARHGG